MMALCIRKSPPWDIITSAFINMSASDEECSGFPWTSTMSASGISGSISSKTRSNTSSASWEIPLALVLVGKVKESPNGILITASNTSLFLISDYLISSSCVNFRIVWRGTIFHSVSGPIVPFNFPRSWKYQDSVPEHSKLMEICPWYLENIPIQTNQIDICLRCLLPHQMLQSEVFVLAIGTYFSLSCLWWELFFHHNNPRRQYGNCHLACLYSQPIWIIRHTNQPCWTTELSLLISWGSCQFCDKTISPPWIFCTCGSWLWYPKELLLCLQTFSMP